MSKPKGRRKPLHSEITSLRRSTDAAEAMPASAPAMAVDESTDDASPVDADEPAHRPAPSKAPEPLAHADAAEEPLLGEVEPRDAEAAEDGPASLDFEESRADSFDPNAVDARPPSNVVSIDGEEPDDMEAFLCGLIEALLFTSQRPLPLKEIARAAGVDRPRARELLERLIRNYSPRGINLEEVAGGYVLRSSARYAPQIQKFLALRPVRLSRAQLETLAIIAYRQPVTKPEVDDIRGVDSGQVLKGLMERSLLKILGKKDEPGRPMLYGTTNDFLELLNLRSLGELPTLREYTELSEESRQKFAYETGEDAPAELPLEAENAGGTLATPGPVADGSLSETLTMAGEAAGAARLEVLEPDAGEAGTSEETQASAHENAAVAPERVSAAAKKDKAKKEEEEESEKDAEEESEEEEDEDEDDESDEDESDEDDEDDEDEDEEDEDEDDLDDEDEDDDDDDDDDESEEDKPDEKD